SIAGLPGRSTTYGQLLGDRRFDVPFTGTAPAKAVSQYKIVGTNVSRNDISEKVSGKYVYMQHVRVPGMLHGRVVRPRGQSAYGAGAKVLSIDETSIRNIPGTRVIRRGDFIGIVADREWDAVRAAQQLKVSWDLKPVLSGNEGLFQQMRSAKTEDRVVLEKGNVANAFPDAAHVATQTCRGPYQAHVPFGPNCALADV